ncbi:MAG: exodeoxyribonuclease III [Mycobacterium sp.]|nr:exodeoxyribonuclease III [Mycobacterium sp.]
MIVTTINVNGVRAAVRERSPENRGLLHWLDQTAADVVCLQETRADDEQFEEHGRYLEVDLDDGTTVGSVYVHTGEAGTDRQVEKERFMATLATRMADLAADGRDAVLCGDWNIAHTEHDIKAWKANVRKAGFLPSERQWLTDLAESGWVDVVRRAHPDSPGPYSWWSWRGQAFDNDAGWRIDYHLATESLAARARAARVEKPAAYALRWSDHAPVTVEFG